jgi:phosphoribosylglycinamide formyltransferase-1
MYKISVLVSGAGSTLDNLAFHCYDEYEGMIRGFIEIAQVVADRPCKAEEVAKKWNLPFTIAKRSDFPSQEEWSNALLPNDVNLHVMGGFLSKIIVPERWKGKILNIHPSLLPAYGGKGMHGIKVHEAVIQNKEQFSGCTVHVVDNEYDHGEIVEQIKQAVLPWDNAESLQDAIQNMEKRLYPRAILNFLRGKRLDRIKISG